MNFSKKIIFSLTVITGCFNGFGQYNKTELTDYVIHELNIPIDKDYTYTNEAIIPYDKDYSIVLVANPAVIEEEYQLIEYDSYIVIINNKTKQIEYNYYESHETNGWISDAIPIESFGFNFSIKPLNDSTKPIGIIIHNTKGGGATQFFGDNLTLLILEDKSLKIVLKNYRMSYESDLIGGGCYRESKHILKKLKLSKRKTNGFYNLIIKSKIKETISDGIDTNGDCKIKSQKKRRKRETLKFNGVIYTK